MIEMEKDANNLLQPGIDWSPNQHMNDFRERLATAYLGKELHSDMTFYVELADKHVPGHSLIVASASPVLEHCIYGTGHIRNPNRVVTIRDCTLDEFYVFLGYIYSGKMSVKNHRMAGSLFLLAHFYDLNQMEKICLDYLYSNLTVQSVCETFNLIYCIENAVIDNCMAMMQTHLPQLLKDGSLMQMSDQALCKFLDQDTLNVRNEIEIFKPMLEWADNQCIENQMLPSSTNRRHFLKNRLYLVRFAALSSKGFIECVSMVGPDFFSPEEISSTMLRIAMGTGYNDLPIDPHFESVRRLPYFIKKEYIIEFEKPSINLGQGVISLSEYRQTIRIGTKLSKESNVQIRGFLIKDNKPEVLVVEGTKATKVDCLHYSDRIYFDPPIRVDNRKELTIAFKSTKLMPQREVVARNQPDHDIFVLAGTWTSVDSVLYYGPNRKSSPRK